MSEKIPYVERLVDLNVLLDKKSHFLFGPRQTGKTSLIRHTLKNVHVYDSQDLDPIDGRPLHHRPAISLFSLHLLCSSCSIFAPINAESQLFWIRV